MMEVLRNVSQAEDLTDAVVLNDGTEEPVVSLTPDPFAPLDMRMRVSILLFKKSDLSVLHAKVIHAVSADAGVRAAYGTKGWMHYDGCETGFSTAERIYCNLAIYFEISYTCNPAKVETLYRRYTILDAIKTALEGITPP